MSGEFLEPTLEVLNAPLAGEHEERELVEAGLRLASVHALDAYPVMSNEGAFVGYLFSEPDEIPTQEQLIQHFPHRDPNNLLVCSRLSDQELFNKLAILNHGY